MPVWLTENTERELVFFVEATPAPKMHIDSIVHGKGRGRRPKFSTHWRSTVRELRKHVDLSRFKDGPFIMESLFFYYPPKGRIKEVKAAGGMMLKDTKPDVKNLYAELEDLLVKEFDHKTSVTFQAKLWALDVKEGALVVISGLKSSLLEQAHETKPALKRLGNLLERIPDQVFVYKEPIDKDEQIPGGHDAEDAF